MSRTKSCACACACSFVTLCVYLMSCVIHLRISVFQSILRLTCCHCFALEYICLSELHGFARVSIWVRCHVHVRGAVYLLSLLVYVFKVYLSSNNTTTSFTILRVRASVCVWLWLWLSSFSRYPCRYLFYQISNDQISI